MRNRLLLGPVMILLLIGSFLLDAWLDRQNLPFGSRLFGRDTFPPGTFLFLLCASVAILASRELAAILQDKKIAASKRITTSAALIGLLVSCLVPTECNGQVGAAIVASSAVLVLVLSLGYYSRHKQPEGIVAAAGGALLAFVYLGLMFGFILAIRREHSVWVLLWVLLVIKASDIGAYFTGKAIGSHKLIPWLSPGKTWEGLFGGIVLSALVGFFGTLLMARADIGFDRPAWHGALAGAIFAVAGQLGDLVMSLFKRDAGLKDSGKALPGFGGVLDVLDSPLLVTPIAYWWLKAGL